jgi:hypothetical protein
METNGGGGIRTPETLTRLTVFKTVSFSRSDTPPSNKVSFVNFHRGPFILRSSLTLGKGGELIFVDSLGGCMFENDQILPCI